MEIRPRKTPVQSRSAATWNSILDGAAQLFERHGYEPATTNEIAMRAGVSIGSLYQYFPNKTAIVTALTERHLGDVGPALAGAFATLRQRQPGLAETLRMLVEACATLHEQSPALHRFIFNEAPRSAETIRLLREVEGAAAALLVAELERLGVGGPRPELRAQLVIQGIEAQIHATLLDRVPWSRQHVVDELVRMWTAALAQPD